MGGNETGIPKDKLKLCFSIVYQLYNAPEQFGNGDIKSSDLNYVNNEVDEVMMYLSTSPGENLSIKDFINAMSSNTAVPFENIELFT